MYKNGFLKVELASPEIKVGNVDFNKNSILNILNKSNASLLVFPELVLTGYTASDLFFFNDLLASVSDCLDYIQRNTKFKEMFIIGAPYSLNGVLYNCAYVFMNKKLIGIVPKRFIPNTHEFYEKRHFVGFDMNKGFIEVPYRDSTVSFGNLLFYDAKKEIKIGIDVCQDMWAIYTPSDDMSLAGANVICNISASPENALKHENRKTAIMDHSRKQFSAYLYTSASYFESSSDVVFSGCKLVGEVGELTLDLKPFSDLRPVAVDIDIDGINFQRRFDSTYRDESLTNRYQYKTIAVNFEDTKDYKFEKAINKFPFLNDDKNNYDLVFNIQVHGLMKKLLSLPEKIRKIVIGVSGGLDSTLALLVAISAFEKLGLSKKDIIAVTMPASVTKSTSKDRAIKLMELTKVTALTIPIDEMVKQHLNDINHKTMDLTYENSQARIRTLVLMDLANKYGGFVLGTGDLSEIALGFMTYSGDQMSMYGINSGVPKTLIKELIKHLSKRENKKTAEVLMEVLSAKISPELLNNQETEKTIGSYDINDFILYYHLSKGFGEGKIIWLVENAFNLSKEESTLYAKRFFNLFYKNQFKRQTLPEGPKVLNISLSPRGDFRLPSDVEPYEKG